MSSFFSIDGPLLRCLALVAVPLAGLPSGNAADRPAALPPGYVSEVLDNGLRVSILPDPDNPVVATQFWLHVGSAHESPQARGFAHLFEHLMFGETTTRAKDDYEKHHRRHGGYENAYTSFDETVYVSVIAPEHHRPVLEMEADRWSDLVLSEANLENEKRIVSEELRLRMENDPFTRVGVAALEAVLGDHPYAHTPGGTREEVNAVTIDRCREFYRNYYSPQNAHLVIVGPVDGAQTLGDVKRLFSVLPPRGISPEEIEPITARSLPRQVIVMKEDLPPAEIAIVAYPLPPVSVEDHDSLAVMQQLLGGGEVDPFQEELVERRGKAVFASTMWIEMRQGGALAFIAAYVPYRRSTTAFRLADETLGTLAELDWLTAESVEAAKRTLVRRELSAVYYADRRADAIGRAQWWFGNEALAFDAARRIERVTAEQVEQAFRRYVLDPEPVRVYLRPQKVPLHVRMFGWLYPLVN